MSEAKPPSRGPIWVALGTQTLFMVGAFAAGIVGVGLIAALLQAGWGIKVEDSPMASLVISPLTIGIAALVYRFAATSADPAATTPLKEAEGRAGWAFSLLLTAGLGLGLVLASTAVSWVFQQLGWAVVEQGRVLELTAPVDGGINPAVFVLAPVAVLMAPLFEEWLFRGWYFRRLHQSGGSVVAYVASALMFAAIHGNVRGTPIYILQAFFFAYAYERTGRLSAAVGVHFINNAITIAILVFAAPAVAP